jgi:hypothetical protein
VDRSPELIETARLPGGQGNSVSFRVGDILALAPAQYRGILCRGVLNDLLNDDARRSVFVAFAGALEPGGVLILDVREWEATKDRKRRKPVFRKTVATDRGTLTFTSTTELDPENRQLLLSETHTLVDDSGEHSTDDRFVMRCWTKSELESAFESGGFGSVAYFGAYDRAIHAGATDRLVAVAQLPRVSTAV